MRGHGAPFECEWDAGERIRAHQIRVVAAMRNGQRLVQTVRTQDLEYVEAVDVDVVQITPIVTDDRGRFVTGLTQKDFQVSEDGKPQKITSFSDEHTPLELVTAIDVSSSVREALPGMKRAATRFLGGLEAADQVTVLGFNDNIFTLARRSTDQVVRERAIGRLAAWGGTALYDAIVQAIGVLGRQTGRRAIVLFTDGDDQSSHAPIETAIAQVEAQRRDDLPGRPGTRGECEGPAETAAAAGDDERRPGVLSRMTRRSSTKSSRRFSTISITSTCSRIPRPTISATASGTV